MKNIRTALLLFVLIAFGQGAWAQTSVTTESDLQTAVGTNNANIQLGADIQLGTYLNINGNTVTIDLNGHKLYRNITGTYSSSGHVIYVHNNAHLTLTNSTGTGSIEDGKANNGGAMFIEPGSTVSANNVTFKNNKAGGHAGAIWNSGSFTATNCTFENNKASDVGGIYNAAVNNTHFGTATLTNCTFSGNYSYNSAGALANAIGNTEMTLNNCTITDNEALTNGGGIWNGGELTITGGSITNNICGKNYKGGGIFNNGRLYMSGGSVVRHNTINGKENNVYIPHKPYGDYTSTIHVSGRFTDDADIGLSPEVNTDELTFGYYRHHSEDPGNYFSADSEDHRVTLDGMNEVVFEGPSLSGEGTVSDPYIIKSTEDWNSFTNDVFSSYPYKDKHILLTNDIVVSNMVGAPEQPFSGIFHGNGRTLTVNISSNEQYAAPFLYINGATIEQLKVEGDIVVSQKFAGGLVGLARGDNNITSCNVATNIHSSVYGEGCHGGIVGMVLTDNTTFTNCLFSGKLLGANTHSCGGFVGWAEWISDGPFSDINLNNCLFDPTEITIQNHSGNRPFVHGHAESVQVHVVSSGFKSTALGGTIMGLAIQDWSSTPYATIVSNLGSGWELKNEKALPKMANTLNGHGTESNPYLIASANDWNQFSEIAQGNDFSGNVVKLTADITVTCMAGSESHPFSGTFDGNGHTLNLNISGITEQGAAPFHYISGATIKNLIVTGSVEATGSNPHAGGLVGFAWSGTNTIENCIVHANVTNSTDGSGTHSHLGGIVGHAKNSTVILTGCVYDGQLWSYHYKGGLIGWADAAAIQLTDCVFNGTVLPETAYFHPIGCCNNGDDIQSGSFVNNSYYDPTHSLGKIDDTHENSIVKITNGTGKKAFRIAGNATTTVQNAGTKTTYAGLSSYGIGIAFDNLLYAGLDDVVSLNLSANGHGVITFNADNGTLSGNANPYTLTMPFADVTITASGDLCEIRDLTQSAYSYGFEDKLQTNRDIDCWTVYCVGNQNSCAILDVTKHTGKYGFMIFNDNASDLHLISPELFAGNNNVIVEFYWKYDMSHPSPEEVFFVGYSTQGNNLNDFTWVETVTPPTPSKWSLYSRVFPVGTKYIAVHPADEMNGLALDDFTFKAAPACIEPNDLEVSNVTAHTAELSWNDVNLVSSDAWQIFLNGNVNPVVTTTENPCTLTGLIADANYLVRMCAIRGDVTSGLSESVSFRTLEACAKPTHLRMTDVGPYSGWANWDGDAEGYQVRYRAIGSEVWIEYPYDATSPYLITDWTTGQLEPEHSYEVQVKAVCGVDGESDWTESVSFTTKNECCNPINISVSETTSVSADLEWTGYQTSYNVRYKKYAKFFDDFENDMDQWTYYVLGDYFENMNGRYFSGWATFNNEHHSGRYSIGTHGFRLFIDPESLSTWENEIQPPVVVQTEQIHSDNWIVSPQLDLGGKLSYWTMWAHKADVPLRGRETERFEVRLSTTGNNVEDFTTILKYSLTDYYDPNLNHWVADTIDLSAYAGQLGYIAFHCESNGGHSLYLDDVVLHPDVQWTNVTTEDNELTLTGLEPNTMYEFEVQGVNSNCGTTDWSSFVTFTTQDGYAFINSGLWNATGNWQNGAIPPSGSDVILYANAIIPANYIVNTNSIGLGTNGSLTIQQGGQLLHTGHVNATLQKVINGFGSNNSEPTGWYTIASPVEGWLKPNNNMLANTYDLYYYSEPDSYWKNYKNNAFDLENGRGYLYANSNSMTLAFTGNMIPTKDPFDINLKYTEVVGSLKGYNLVGNPFTRNLNAGEIMLNGEPLSIYYMVEGGDELVTCNLSYQPILPGQGFFVQATGKNQTLSFGTQNRGGRGMSHGILCIEVGNGNIMDRAFVQIGSGNTLRKMNISDKTPRLSVIHDGRDWAAATIESPKGQLPVHFKAAESGTYTLTVNPDGMAIDYLHLIDHLTGADIDLITTPSYTFEAKTDDYASRFKLVFNAIDNNEESEDFAFISNGKIIINGTGTLQVIDMLGRIIVSKDHVQTVSTTEMVPGVYVLRLIDGEKVKTQKIVIR